MTREISFDEYSEMMEKRNEEDGFFDDDIEDSDDEHTDYNDNVENMFLAFVDYIGMESDGKRLYNFFFTNTPDVVWNENWEICPASACGKLSPNPSTYHKTITIKSLVEIEMAQNNSCVSMQDVIDQILGLAWFEYDGSITVFKFGETWENIIDKINQKKWIINF